MRTYDCFTFFNELDLLEIRLNELHEVVDTFVIVEAPLTFQGKQKPLFFQENRARFAKFDKQIRHIVVTDLPQTDDPWQREFHQRNELKRGMTDAAPDDLVIISDIDEIPTPAAINALKIKNDFAYLQLKFYVYYLNYEIVDGVDIPWIKAYAAPWKRIQSIADLSARDGRHPQSYLKSINLGELNQHIIENAGWHFSWLGNPQRMIQKLNAFSHTEAHTKPWHDQDFLARSIAQRRYFVTNARLSVRPLDEMPLTIQNASEHYLNLGLLGTEPKEKTHQQKKNQLPQVTLCAIDTGNTELTVRAIESSQEDCAFGDVVFFTNRVVKGAFRVIEHPPLSNIRDLVNFWLHEAPKHLKTPYVLTVQHDGFVVNSSLWRPEFLDYDFIGVKWCAQTGSNTVGNSGFSLMSKKIMNLWASPVINPQKNFSLEHLFHVLRPRLESEYGIRFAPDAVANQFSYEYILPREPTFGFHGILNMWRHLSDEEMEITARKIADYMLPSPLYLQTISQYYLMRKFGPLRAFYARLKGKTTIEEIHRRLASQFNAPFAQECIAICEALMQNQASTTLTQKIDFTDQGIKQRNEEIDAYGRLFPWERASIPVKPAPPRTIQTRLSTLRNNQTAAPKSTKCPVCDSAELAPSATKFGSEYQSCRRCGVVFCPPIDPTVIETHNSDPESRAEIGVQRTRLQRVIQHIGRRPEKILDFGCGRGDYLEFLQQQGLQAIGVDQHTELKLSDIAPQSINFINMVEVIEHLYDPIAILTQLRDLLTKDGIIYVESSFVDFLGNPADSSYIDPRIGHCCIHSRRSISHLCRKVNMLSTWLNNNVVILNHNPPLKNRLKPHISLAPSPEND